jgi:hypothetical protein
MKYRIKHFAPLLLLIGLLTAKTNYAATNAHDPILVLATDRNFGSFTGEILKTEGFNEFRMDSLTDKTKLSYLKKFDVVVLAETSVTDLQMEMLARYVKEGGSLIAFRPDRKLSDIFGMSDRGATVAEGYIAINTSEGIGKGITSESLQIHGEADQYDLKGGIKIADLCKDGKTATGQPAVVINDYGKGHAMAFVYNLPQSIVYTRQGNYRNAGQEMDGITGIRAMDMFTNGWVDTTKNVLNQADEQMRLLSHGIEKMNSYSKPLPRFWYFPDSLKCLVTLNNDGEDSKEAEFQPQFADVDAKGAKMTLYVKETDFISERWITEWRNKGFEISGHPNDTRQAVNPDWNTMDSVYKELLGRLNKTYGVPGMKTVVNHWFVWTGKDADGTKNFAAQARIEEQNGVRLDCNYARYDNLSSQGHFLGAMGTNQGNFTGSGLVMRFADIRGGVINVYQQLNSVYDQQYMEHKDQDGFFNCFRGLMDRSLNDEVYSFICIKAHNAEYFFSKIPLMKMLDYANDKGIPVWTEQRLLGFLSAREEAGFDRVNWAGDVLSFKIKSTLKDSSKLTCMIPYYFNGKRINKITVNGNEQSYIIRSVKGFEYAMLPVKPGSDYRIKASYMN